MQRFWRQFLDSWVRVNTVCPQSHVSVGCCPFSIFPMVGEVAATPKGPWSGVALGVVHGGLPKTFQGFLRHVILSYIPSVRKICAFVTVVFNCTAMLMPCDSTGPPFSHWIPSLRSCPRCNSLGLSRDSSSHEWPVGLSNS